MVQVREEKTVKSGRCAPVTGATAMGPKKAMSSGSDGAADDQDHLALRLIELLSDDQVVATLQKCLIPRELTATIDNLSDRIRRLDEKLDSKDELIKSLETRIVTLESTDKITRIPDCYPRVGRR